MSDWWRYENLPSGAPYDWGTDAARGDHETDNLDFHLDLGCGTVKKARLGIDRHPAPGVDLTMDLNDLIPVGLEGRPTPTDDLFEEALLKGWLPKGFGLPFPDGSIESIITHHCLEHIGDGFVNLMDECHRVLVPGGVMRIIVPLFPSRTAVEDPDHKRYFMEGTFETFCGTADGSHWHESFSVPYTTCRFEMTHKDMTSEEDAGGPTGLWGPDGAREIRVALRKHLLAEVA